MRCQSSTCGRQFQPWGRGKKPGRVPTTPILTRLPRPRFIIRGRCALSDLNSFLSATSQKWIPRANLIRQGRTLPSDSTKEPPEEPLDSGAHSKAYTARVSTKVQIGQLAKVSGSSIDTIRYYEKLGLLPLAERKKSGYRLYPMESAGRLRFIRQAQAAGFRLDEIRQILRMTYADQSPCDCARRMLKRRLAEMEEQSKTLAAFRRKLRKTLERTRGLPRLSHEESAICPLSTDRAR